MQLILPPTEKLNTSTSDVLSALIVPVTEHAITLFDDHQSIHCDRFYVLCTNVALLGTMDTSQTLTKGILLRVIYTSLLKRTSVASTGNVTPLASAERNDLTMPVLCATKMPNLSLAQHIASLSSSWLAAAVDSTVAAPCSGVMAT